MRFHVREIRFATATFVLAGWAVLPGNPSAAGDKAEMVAAVQKLADALQAGDADQVKKLAADTAKSFELEDVMKLMGLRKPNAKSPAFGFGEKPGAKPDGIEAKLIAIGKRVDSGAAQRDSADFVKMAYRVAAIGEIAKVRAPEKDEGAKKKKDWLEWCDAMVKESTSLADAAKTKQPAAIKAAAGKLNASCNNCHGVFRD
jgi:cytochrome c'